MNLTKTGMIVFLALLISAPGLASAQSVPELAKKALAATVSLELQDENGDTLKRGSGFFVRENLIATNFHVIDGTTQGSAKLVNTKTKYSIDGVTGIDEENDLALLSVSVPNITPLCLGDSDAAQVGASIYVAGNPKGFEGTFSNGIISGRRDIATKRDLLQMTAPISRGSSGGPVLNESGEVIGMSTLAYNNLWAQNLNFAVPSKAIQALLARSGETKPLWYGNATVSYSKYMLRGFEKISWEDFEGSIREFTHAIYLDADNAKAYVARGFAKLKLNRHSAAILDYDKAIRLYPNDAKAYARRGVSKEGLGQYSAAILDYNEAIRLDPDDVLAYVDRGFAQERLGQYAAAILDYNEAIRLDPDDVLAYVSRGVAKSGVGEHSAAILDFDAAIRLTPDDANAYYSRGHAWKVLHRSQQAKEDFKAALRRATRANDHILKAAIEEALRQLEQ